jgi:ABC-type transport system involved in cytochrome c biogenesis permease subunit
MTKDKWSTVFLIVGVIAVVGVGAAEYQQGRSPYFAKAAAWVVIAGYALFLARR